MTPLLAIVRQVPPFKGSDNARVEVRCFCGEIFITRASSLRNGHTKSCGCLKKAKAAELAALRFRKHGEARRTAEYKTWAGMIARTTIPSVDSWKYYGGLGVTVCERWRYSYENFLKDMGRRPSVKHSIDRFPNPSGNYEPGNCRWATKREQRLNQRERIGL